jgi:2-C-methyl-D-erythritol 4-phosphate cytidylyltransferase/2-C-methyl-D-erythritol 2,4-cyclodiphosphate synthase
VVTEVVIALPQGALAGRHDFVADLEGRRDDCRIVLVEGGARRQDSTANAFASVAPDADVVLVHDAARPFASRRLIERTIEAAHMYGAAIAALPAVDTIKQAKVDGGHAVVAATLARETIYLAQTPQAFRRDVLSEAMAAAAGAAVTDEAMLVERAGFSVHIVEGDPDNVKVTTSADLSRARARLSGQGATSMRIGTGYDLHRLVEGRRLILAGVQIPFERGLLGHSDADIVCHAVTDAVLGAAALGDIGRLFPDTDARWKDADSVELLRAAAAFVQTNGMSVANVDVTVIAQRPKLLPYLDAMRANLAGALGVDVSAVSIKGKTNEGVDATGTGEAMACHAVALLRASP